MLPNQIIVSDQVGCARDLVRHGINGFLVPVGDINSLTKRLRTLTENPDIAESMGKQGLKRISDWNFDANVRGLVKALDHMTEQEREN